MHDMAQPFFVWARHERLPIARGYLLRLRPARCFVDNFLTWAEPVLPPEAEARPQAGGEPAGGSYPLQAGRERRLGRVIENSEVI